jgi:hypothetical protein
MADRQTVLEIETELEAQVYHATPGEDVEAMFRTFYGR